MNTTCCLTNRVSALALLSLILSCTNVDTTEDAGVVDNDSGSFSQETELSIDDDSCEMTNGPGGDTGPGGMIANCFTPPNWPLKIKSARFFVASIGNPTTTFGVKFFHEENGKPGEEIVTGEITGSAEIGDSWASVDVLDEDVVVESGNFCVAMVWLTPFGSSAGNPDSQALCSDNDNPLYASWILWSQRNQWQAFEDIGVMIPTNAMIRATVLH